jgi:hypothetical protein
MKIDDMDKFKMDFVTREDLDAIYGERKVEVGKCFVSNDNHFYSQRTDHVLHITSEKDLVNLLPQGYLNRKEKFKEISQEEFRLVAAEAIYKMELEKFWKK